MPIYEYKCSQCAKKLEIIQRVSDPPLQSCPDCSGKLEKLLSQSSFHLKGTGWYVTDYARKSSKPAEKESSGGEKPTTEVKAAEKVTTKSE